MQAKQDTSSESMMIYVFFGYQNLKNDHIIIENAKYVNL